MSDFEFDMRGPGTAGSRRFVCMICMYVYDEAEGDPDSGLPPGTLWEDIPDDWRCPVCGAAKSYFENEALFTQRRPSPETPPSDEAPDAPQEPEVPGDPQ